MDILKLPIPALLRTGNPDFDFFFPLPILKTRQMSRLLFRLRRDLSRNECSSGANPCRNGGTCVDTYNSFFCLCPPEWEGDTCEEDVNECAQLAGTDLGCQNGAACQNLPGAYQCHCTPGFYGVHCADRSNTCASGSQEETCGHGRCVDTSAGVTCICEQARSSSCNSRCKRDLEYYGRIVSLRRFFFLL